MLEYSIFDSKLGIIYLKLGSNVNDYIMVLYYESLVLLFFWRGEFPVFTGMTGTSLGMTRSTFLRLLKFFFEFIPSVTGNGNAIGEYRTQQHNDPA